MDESQVDSLIQTIFQGSTNAGGDIKIDRVTQIGSQTIINKKISFFELELKPFRKPEFVGPKIASGFAKVLCIHHCLVLGDGVNVDKSFLAKHIATLLTEELSNAHKAVVVKEWDRSSNSGDIEFELEDSEVYKILILTQVSPQNLLGYTFSDIQKIASRKNHFVIATTELPFDAWHLLDSCRVWWRDLSEKDVADCERLINKLSDEEALNSWYHKQLDPRGQLLAIGLSLFDGLFDDQFFAALEVVVSNAWQNRDSNLKALDYCDLDNLRNYFDFIDTDDQRTLVKIRFPKQRFTCLKIAWKSHRRQILAALPILVDIIKNTTKNSSGELYGSLLRREKIRQSASEAISGVGLISRLGSREAVEGNLLTLAASSEIEVQAVAAQSIASWRDQENRGFVLNNQPGLDIDEELFSILESWQTETQINRFISLFLKDKAAEERNEPSDYIRATLAITIAYASLYDASGKLPSKLCLLFKDLSRDKNKLVRDRFKQYALPIFIGRHLSTIRDFMHSMVNDTELIRPIAESLALAYRFNTVGVLSLLEEWKNACKVQYKTIARRGRLEQRESLLVTLTLTYSQIFQLKNIDVPNGIDVRTCFSKLFEILKFERHEIVRAALISAIGDLLKYNSELLNSENGLVEVVRYLSHGKETELLVSNLSDIYLNQRSELEEGDTTVKIGEATYPVWIRSSERKSTDIENIFLAWIKDDSNKRLQEIAAQSLMSFVKDFEGKEQKALTALKVIEENAKSPIPSGEREISQEPYKPEPPQESAYLTKFIPWLATRKAESYRLSVSHLLPKTAQTNLLNSSSAGFLIQKLGKSADSKLVSLSRFLNRGLWLSKNFWALSLTLGAAALYSAFSVKEVLDAYTLSSSNAPQQTIESSEPVRNPFEDVEFPQPSCGDPLPSDASAYPVQSYPIFVNYSDSNLSQVKTSFCRDALATVRKDKGVKSIQTASFLSREKAELFKDYLSTFLTGVEVGNPSTIEKVPASTPTTPSLLQPFDKGSVQPANTNFNAEIFDPPSNCRTGPGTDNPVHKALQKGDILIDINNPKMDRKGEIWYEEQYLGCWLHHSQIRIK